MYINLYHQIIISFICTQMRFHVLSDIHLEFFQHDHVPIDTFLTIPNEPKNHTLLLAGDIGYPWMNNYIHFMKDACKVFEHVLFILGNHEFYSNGKYTMEEINVLASRMADELKLENLHCLQNQAFELKEENLVILGTTLWSPISKQNESNIKHSISDYRCISSTEKWNNITCAEVTQHYNTNKKWLETQLTQLKQLQQVSNKQVIVLTHHVPSLTTLIADKYKGSPEKEATNEAFGSNLEGLMEQFENLKYWVAGHTHTGFQTKIHHTQIRMNPRGYSIGEEKAENSNFILDCIFDL
ncbi:MAG: metallophosphatase [Sylvanvirus sp.]|uniref:Metallophosphatase n=1 Tax=Sylvanvirus sp. TaxID=2487774 RepID=A0A3G5AI62_9VIRU|nr:MAG: metallophosphatase [Sylvanvirus sp.]